MPKMRGQHGFSLLEVLIALLIFSLGLLGMAALMVVSVKANQSAYVRTQASFIAEAMANRMRGNLANIPSYNDSYTPGAGSDPCTGGVPCSTSDIVAHDQWLCQQQMQEFLPNSSATIDCDGVLLGSGAQAASSPFDGLCTISLSWSEAALERSAGGNPDTQTFAWVFQP